MKDLSFTNYDYRLSINSKNYDVGCINEFANHLVDSSSQNSNFYKKTEKVKALNNMLANLIIADFKKIPLAISLTASNCSIPKMYGFNYYSITNIRYCLDLLSNCGYIDFKKGSYNKERKKGKRSRIVLTSRFFEKYDEFTKRAEKSNNSNVQFLYIDKHCFETPILLKDENKQLINYDKDTLGGELRELFEYNEAMEAFIVREGAKYRKEQALKSSQYNNQDIDIRIYPLYITRINSEYHSLRPCAGRIYLYRVFNNSSFSDGGRFYGAFYQGIKSEERRYLRIDDSTTTEVDYKALHPRMLYHMRGIDYVEDPYILENNTVKRGIIKEIFNIAINAGNYNSAIKAFNNSLHHKSDSEKFAILKYMRSNNLKTKDLIKMIFDKHPKLKDYLFTGMGVKLQNIDSKIANSIMQSFIKMNKPVLCIHDSFIVKKEDKGLLADMMSEFYKHYMNGYDCELKFIEGIETSQFEIAA